MTMAVAVPDVMSTDDADEPVSTAGWAYRLCRMGESGGLTDGYAG